MNSLSNKKKDPELRNAAKAFVQAFSDAAASSREDAIRIFEKRGWIGFEGGIVEWTDELTVALTKFVERAAKMLGPKGGNENAIRELALKEAQDALIKKSKNETAASQLIESVFREGSAQFEFLVPNYLLLFNKKVRSIRVGRACAGFTSDLADYLRVKSPNDRIKVVPGDGFSIKYSGSPVTASIEMYPIAWLVTVNAAQDNVEEEAKWLIDIAVSLLRLHYKVEGFRFPRNGTVEPHPLRPRDVDKVGVKIRGSSALVGGAEVPHAYEISEEIQSIVAASDFRSKAKLIFDPTDKSVAARVGQGLGWLTRGRQAEDRSERLLYFFTAIEALLSTDDKTAPIVQTIARHAAVLLTNDMEDRVGISALMKKLYALRSALVHNGSRGVLWSSTNTTQYLAEAMFSRVLDEVDLGSNHVKFCDDLVTASFGLPWPLKDKQST
jgi:hypothetical protein